MTKKKSPEGPGKSLWEIARDPEIYKKTSGRKLPLEEAMSPDEIDSALRKEQKENPLKVGEVGKTEDKTRYLLPLTGKDGTSTVRYTGLGVPENPEDVPSKTYQTTPRKIIKSSYPKDDVPLAHDWLNLNDASLNKGMDAPIRVKRIPFIDTDGRGTSYGQNIGYGVYEDLAMINPKTYQEESDIGEKNLSQPTKLRVLEEMEHAKNRGKVQEDFDKKLKESGAIEMKPTIGGVNRPSMGYGNLGGSSARSAYFDNPEENRAKPVVGAQAIGIHPGIEVMKEANRQGIKFTGADDPRIDPMLDTQIDKWFKTATTKMKNIPKGKEQDYKGVRNLLDFYKKVKNEGNPKEKERLQKILRLTFKNFAEASQPSSGGKLPMRPEGTDVA